jgi:hypothetical protein
MSMSLILALGIVADEGAILATLGDRDLEVREDVGEVGVVAAADEVRVVVAEELRGAGVAREDGDEARAEDDASHGVPGGHRGDLLQ